MQIKILMLTIIAIFSCLSYAGWSSGGGELIRDGHNPWFLNNTKEIRYCVEVDEVNFGRTFGDVVKVTQAAIGFWQLSLKDLKFYVDKNGQKIEVGSQPWILKQCSEKVDVRFQFGFLTELQKQEISNIHDIVALTVRTDYDKINLKGSGFVYVAPESGELQMDPSVTIENPWSQQKEVRLLPVLTHEIGHIFGIQHNTNMLIMSDNFPEQIVAKDQGVPYMGFDYSGFISEKRLFYLDNANYQDAIFTGIYCPKSSSFKPMAVKQQNQFRRLNNRNSSDAVPTFFGVPEERKGCLMLQKTTDGFDLLGNSSTDPAIGHIRNLELQKDMPRVWSDAIINLWIPKEQRVFTPVYNNGSTILASGFTHWNYRGHYESADGKTKEVWSLKRVIQD